MKILFLSSILLYSSTYFCFAENKTQLNPKAVPQDSINTFLGIGANKLTGDLPNTTLSIRFTLKKNGSIIQEETVGGAFPEQHSKFVEYVHTICSGLTELTASKICIKTGTQRGSSSQTITFTANPQWYSHTDSPAISKTNGKVIWKITGKNIDKLIDLEGYNLAKVWKKTTDGFIIEIITS